MVYLDPCSSTVRFLVAKLHMNTLAEQPSQGALRDALKSLPDSVDQTYEQAMRRVSNQVNSRRELGMQTLMWVACARRPLMITELQHALGTKPNINNPMDYAPDASVITASCAGLVVIEDQSNTITFVREFRLRISRPCFSALVQMLIRHHCARILRRKPQCLLSIG
jgi:hypothetical protein